jgi:hypothetical protein
VPGVEPGAGVAAAAPGSDVVGVACVLDSVGSSGSPSWANVTPCGPSAE